MDAAQEEVLVCVGLLILQQIQNLQMQFRQVMRHFDVAVGVLSLVLKRKFGIAIEEKLGMSQSDILCHEMIREEELKRKKEQVKKEKRQRQKERKVKEEVRWSINKSDKA
jgi:hypothetical protein